MTMTTDIEPTTTTTGETVVVAAAAAAEDDAVAAENFSTNKYVHHHQQQQYRMVALDLDGTLLNSQHRLSQATIDYLRHLDQQGFIIVLATGRAIVTVYETIAALNFPHPLPVVCSNGAEGLLCSVAKDGTGTIHKEPLFHTPVPLPMAQRTIELSYKMGFVSQYYVGDSIYADPRKDHHFQLTRLYTELTGSKTIYVQDFFQEALQQGPPSKQLVLCRPDEQDDMMAAFEKEFSKEELLIDGTKKIHIVRGYLGWFMEVLHPDVCKGHGLQKMCDYLHIPISECLAFGDGDNDYEFIQMAGKGFAMKNARDVVKAVAHTVIPYSNDEDGVIKTLQVLEEKEQCLIFQYSK